MRGIRWRSRGRAPSFEHERLHQPGGQRGGRGARVHARAARAARRPRSPCGHARAGAVAAPPYSEQKTEVLLAAFDKNVAEARAALAAARDPDFAVSWSLKRGPQVLMSLP